MLRPDAELALVSVRPPARQAQRGAGAVQQASDLAGPGQVYLTSLTLEFSSMTIKKIDNYNSENSNKHIQDFLSITIIIKENYNSDLVGPGQIYLKLLGYFTFPAWQ